MQKIMLWLRGLAIILVAVLISAISVGSVKAQTLDEIRKAKEEAQKEKAASESELKGVRGDIEEISEEKAQVEEEIEELDALLFDLLLEVELMQSDIEDKNIQIEQAKIDLADAIEREEAQKKAMALRIKYMYEKGNESYMEILIESKSIAEAVNKVEYTEKLYSYDRIMLEEYQLAKQDVANNKAQLETDLSELEEMEEDLEVQQQELNALIEEKQETVDNFASQLARAKAKASEYEKQIKQQTDNLKKINQAEQEKVAEEAKRKAEEEARRKAEEAVKKKAEEDAKKKNNKNDSSSKTADGIQVETTDSTKTTDKTDSADKNSTTDSSESTDYSEELYYYLLASGTGSDKTTEGTTDSTTDSSKTTDSSTTTQTTTSLGTSTKATGSGKGTDIANYALQFVGNPYVSGGTSLTEGCDCSGFTQTVYSNFGISIPRSSSSQSQGGTEVTYDSIQAGDIIYYGGHVAIYIGNDQIVHASTASTGIKISSAFYRSIITIRRYY